MWRPSRQDSSGLASAWRGLSAVGSMALVLALSGGCKPEARPEATATARPVKLMVVGGEQESFHHYYPAKVRSSQRVKLAFQVSGKLRSFPVKACDLVKRGQTLAEVDPRDFESNLKSATATYTKSKSDLLRYAKLTSKQAASMAEFEEKRKSYEVAEAAMRIAAKALEDTRLLAPFDGVIAGTSVDNFQDVQAKQEILSLQGVEEIELVVNIPEKDVIASPAMSLREQFDAMFKPTAVFPALDNKAFPLRLKEFETEADTAMQTFKAVLSMPAPQEFNILPGMSAMLRVVDVQGAGNGDAVLIPASAVAEDSSGRRHVWVVDDKMLAHKRLVDSGPLRDERIAIKSGLAKGDVVVVSGVSFLAEGMAVRELTRMGDSEISAAPKAL